MARSNVRSIQRKVNTFGYGLKVDGRVGKATEEAVIELLSKVPKDINENIIADNPNESKVAHFSLSEFKCRNGTFVPSKYLENVHYLMDKLEVLRIYIGNKPIHIRSAYRTPVYNKAVGGASNSQHLYACAADIYVKGITARELAIKILELFEPEYLEKKNEKYLKQLGIGLGGNSIVHIDFGVACGTRSKPADWFYDGSRDFEHWLGKAK